MDDDGPMVQDGGPKFAVGSFFGMCVNGIQLRFQGFHFLQPEVYPSHGVFLLQGRSLIPSVGGSRKLLPEVLSAAGMHQPLKIFHAQFQHFVEPRVEEHVLHLAARTHLHLQLRQPVGLVALVGGFLPLFAVEEPLVGGHDQMPSFHVDFHDHPHILQVVHAEDAVEKSVQHLVVGLFPSKHPRRKSACV